MCIYNAHGNESLKSAVNFKVESDATIRHTYFFHIMSFLVRINERAFVCLSFARAL